jgi:dihydroxy-acid dehydratase
MARKRRRSQEWFGAEGKMGFIYRSWVKNRGIPARPVRRPPVIGICNTYSELTPCNSHFRTLAEHVKAGVWEAAASRSISRDVPGRDAAPPRRDALPQPRQHGRRGVDPRQSRSTAWCCSWAATRPRPRSSWGASSVDLPTIGVSGGPDALGLVQGAAHRLGHRTPGRSRRTCAPARSRRTSSTKAESCMHRSHGHCMVMGTASTMASMVEALGVGPAGQRGLPCGGRAAAT